MVKTQGKSLSENPSMKLEERRISPRMGLSILPFSKEMRLMSKATTTRRLDYFHLPRPLWRKIKKRPPNKRKTTRRGGRPRASDRAVISGIWCTCFGPAASGRRFIGIASGSPLASSTSVSEDGGGWASLREADGKDGLVLPQRAGRDRLEEVASDGFQELCAIGSKPVLIIVPSDLTGGTLRPPSTRSNP